MPDLPDAGATGGCQGREGLNQPTRQAITKAAMTTIPARKNTAKRQIIDRSAA